MAKLDENNYFPPITDEIIPIENEPWAIDLRLWRIQVRDFFESLAQYNHSAIDNNKWTYFPLWVLIEVTEFELALDRLNQYLLAK